LRIKEQETRLTLQEHDDDDDDDKLVCTGISLLVKRFTSEVLGCHRSVDVVLVLLTFCCSVNW